ncbi:hypothetical protein P168DRAFT_295281 [Aspergillus campestris IBT 28561]|uniref:CCCH zinc finger and SMR domain protein n=1 Tax=Aspergillus campestris (strain IBT 28561) TaxID=1392248 RepID=A0A2I1DC41_ASPC2|nr:uncharacterized protein P168DRAFT_295281 [Aspergillus campestris IBT 28561]PKY07462.1 hypothetical protein P168DRAFT_295281 [Aspergillus campestris IBT 28561]
MIEDTLLEECLRILQDGSLDEEEQAEKIEDFLREKTTLSGASLENAVLDVLWRHRSRTVPDSSPPPPRPTIIRRSSPAPWQMARSSTPLSPHSNLGTSPGSASFLQSSRGGFSRPPLSSTVSPFTSPRPSPRLALAQPIPHSPNLNAYEFSDQSQVSEFYGDFGSDSNVDWLVADDANSTTSSLGALSATAPEFVPDMSPHDILRTVLGDKRSNDEIETALEANSYDLGATIAALSQPTDADTLSQQMEDTRVVVGKSMMMEPPRIVPSPSQNRSPVVCKYWLSTGQCLRADCRFSHDLTNHLCKYWVMGNCLAGDGCPFSHDPSALVANLSMTDGSHPGSSSSSPFQAENASEAFPPLQPAGDLWAAQFGGKYPAHLTAYPGMKGVPQMAQYATGKRNGSMTHLSRPHSRPGSRHQHRELNPSAPSVDDPDAFPTLAAVSAKNTGKKNGKRGAHRDHHSKENIPASLADVVRMSPSPASSKGKASKGSKEGSKGRENSAAALAIPPPQNIPWLETGVRTNQQYIKYRTEAIRHGTVRNKFLQSAAQAWNRNDARAAKALSLRGQAENEAMRRCHREAARQLYEERNKHLLTAGLEDSTEELYVDLHGLHPEEAIEYLEKILLKHAREGRRVVYAITGTGHHSKNGKDKIGKAVKAWLNEWKYVFREFSVPGERGGYVGGILGINATSYDKSLAQSMAEDGERTTDGDGNPPVLMMGKIQLLKREDLEPTHE